MEKLIITPKTKIYDLLEAYPQLENTLISAAPEFKKLKNPVLKKTITRITNIEQAATIGRLKTEDLVNRLRKEAGQETVGQMDDSGEKYNTVCPEWFNQENISNTIDIRDMLHAGEQPVHEVLSTIKKLGENEILKIIAPFIPAPLIDKSASLGYRHWIDEKSKDEYWIYFHK